jgi:hypothetical protein
VDELFGPGESQVVVVAEPLATFVAGRRTSGALPGRWLSVQRGAFKLVHYRSYRAQTG